MPRTRKPAPAMRSAAVMALGLCVFLAIRAQPSIAVVDETACAQPAEVTATGGWSTDVDCRTRSERSPVQGPARLLFGLPLDLNRSDARSLEVLPRIGPARAQAIVDARNRSPFTDLDDLRRVHGIGSATIAGLEGLAAGSSEEGAKP